MSFICCERNDESKYLHTCSCPTIEIICQSLQIDAELCGFSEFSGDESSPPKKYTTQSIFDFRGSSDPSSPDYCGDGYWSGTTVRLYTPVGTECGVSALTSAPIGKFKQNGDSDGSFNAVPFPCYDGQTATVCTWIDPPPCTRNVITTLTIEDTEQDAIDRADLAGWADGVSCSSLWEVRDTGFELTQRTVKYAILLKDLIVGLTYVGSVPTQSREALVGTTDTWVTDTPVSIASFVATDTYRIIDGTLNVLITSDEFKDANFSLDPLDYGLAASAKVITATEDLDYDQGYEFEIGINPDGDEPYIDRV